MHRNLFLCIYWVIVLPAFSQNLQLGKKDLKELRDMMAGTFSSEAQSKVDAEFFHISLEMQPIWQKNKDGYWLYVEQAMATTKDKPYRQRVYHLYQHDDNTLVSQVYELKDPERFAGKASDPAALTSLTPDQLVSKEGCGIYLRKTKKGIFEGSTEDKACPSNLRGARFTTSKVTLTKEGMESWDQGWDANGQQVWGATKGGYRFDKIKAAK